MNCPKCSGSVPDGSVFCNHCGTRLVKRPKKGKARGNGQGCAIYNSKTHTWTAQVVVGYKPPSDPSKQPVPIKRTKFGFKKKEDAIFYCKVLKDPKAAPKVHYTLKQVYDMWEPWYEPRVGSVAGYRSAYKHFSDLNERPIDSISAGDLQECMDKCPAGKRTHQMMKVTAGLIWAYAYDHDMVDKKITENLYTGKGASVKREPLTEDEVKVIYKHLEDEPYAEYVYCLCFLGFRPGELLELRKDQLHEEKDILYLIAGKKTDAGRNRIVPIPPAILDIIRKRAACPGTDLLFPMRVFSRKGTFQGYRQMSDSYFRESVFKPMMARLGIAEGKVPYGARHTYANKLKKAEGADIDKAALIGHSDYTFTQTHYQTTNIEELAAITSGMK